MARIQSRLDEFNGPTREALRALAGSALTEDTLSPDAAALASARAAGVIHEDEDVFVDGDAHAQALAESVLSEAADTLGDAAALTAILHRLWRYGFRGHVRGAYAQVSPGARLLASLGDEGHDVLGVLPDLYGAPPPEGEVPQQVAVAVRNAIAVALSALGPTAEQALAVGRAAAAVSHVRTSGSNFAGLAGVAHADAAVASAMLDALDTDDPVDRALIPHVLHGLSRRDLSEALRLARDLADEPTTAAVGALALGGLAVEPGSPEAERALDALDALAEAHPHEVAEALAHAPGRADPERAARILERVSGAGGGDQAAHSLLMLGTRSVAALQALARSQDLSIEGIDHLRGLLDPLAEQDSDVVLDVAEAYVLARPYGSSGVVALDDAFPNALLAIPDDPWARRLPSWFGSNDERLRRAAADLVNDAAHRGRTWRLHPDALSPLDAADLLYLARQILGRVRNGEALASLTLSFFDAPALPDPVGPYLEEQLVNFVGYAHPGETGEVAGAVTDQRTETYRVAQAVAQSLQQYWHNRSSALPRTEFRPPQVRTRAHVAAETKLRQQLLDAARAANPSIVDQLFTTIQIRAGSGFATRMPDGSLSVTPMQEHSITGFAPWGDLIDPVGMRLRRLHYIQIPRGGDPILRDEPDS